MSDSTARSAIIVGAAGQDGQLLFESLRAQGWRVLGIDRTASVSTESGWSASGIDIGDDKAVRDTVRRFGPDEIYYLAAHHNASEGQIENDGELLRKSLQTNVLGLTHFLEAMRDRGCGSRL